MSTAATARARRARADRGRRVRAHPRARRCCAASDARRPRPGVRHRARLRHGAGAAPARRPARRARRSGRSDGSTRRCAPRCASVRTSSLHGVPPHAAVAETVDAVAARSPRARGFVNGVLRALAPARRRRGPSPTTDAVALSHPDWIVERLVARARRRRGARPRWPRRTSPPRSRCAPNPRRVTADALEAELRRRRRATSSAGALVPDALLVRGQRRPRRARRGARRARHAAGPGAARRSSPRRRPAAGRARADLAAAPGGKATAHRRAHGRRRARRRARRRRRPASGSSTSAAQRLGLPRGAPARRRRPRAAAARTGRSTGCSSTRRAAGSACCAAGPTRAGGVDPDAIAELGRAPARRCSLPRPTRCARVASSSTRCARSPPRRRSRSTSGRPTHLPELRARCRRPARRGGRTGAARCCCRRPRAPTACSCSRLRRGAASVTTGSVRPMKIAPSILSADFARARRRGRAGRARSPTSCTST